VPLSAQEWHTRFQKQATWTESIRSFILERVPIRSTAHILEVGCGTGAILEDIRQIVDYSVNNSGSNGLRHSNIHGLDINETYITLAQANLPLTSLVIGDAVSLPYRDNSYNITYCHFLLMWLDEPDKAVLEMQRVTLPGGMVIAFAEPDYGGRIDYPPELEELGILQTKALESQMADPYMGRKLASVFSQAGLTDIQVGVLGGNWKIGDMNYDSDSEWAVVFSDLEAQVPEDKLNKYKNISKQAHVEGTRILFVPTFYAVGRVIE